MRLYIEDTYTYPDASRDQIQQAFDAFEGIIEQYAFAARQIGDLETATDLGKRQLSYMGFVDCPDGQGARSCVARAHAVMGQFATLYALERDLAHVTAGRHLTVRAADDSFAAVQELTFTFPAP